MRTAGAPSEVHDDLNAESNEHGQRHTKPWNPVDQIAARELVEHEAAVVGKKVRRQPEQVRLCEHSHAECVAESVGAVVEEKKHEDTTRRGVRNIAIELGVALAPVEFAPVELTNPESLAADVDVFMPATRPSSVVPAMKYRE